MDVCSFYFFHEPNKTKAKVKKKKYKKGNMIIICVCVCVCKTNKQKKILKHKYRCKTTYAKRGMCMLLNTSFKVFLLKNKKSYNILSLQRIFAAMKKARQSARFGPGRTKRRSEPREVRHYLRFSFKYISSIKR